MRERTEKAVNLEGKRLLDIKELCFYLSLGRNNASELGKEAGARVQFGTRVLYDRKKIDAWIDRKTGVADEKS